MKHNGMTISTVDHQSFSAYLAPAKSGKGPGMVMIQEVFGVNQFIRDIADQFAAENYTVVAPDLFWRFKPNIALSYTGKDLEEAFDYYRRFDLQKGVEDICETIKALRHHPNCNGKIVVLGFCLGGTLAFLTAAKETVDATVAFYGGGIASHLEAGKNITCPLLMHFGEQDETILPPQLKKIQTAFAEKANVEIDVYPNAGHGFYNHLRASYHAESAEIARNKTLHFLKKYI